MTENNLQHRIHFVQEEFKKLMTRSCFVALTAAIVALWSPVGVRDNLKDIWNSPGRIEAIENDINEINERLSVIKLDEDKAVASLNDQ